MCLIKSLFSSLQTKETEPFLPEWMDKMSYESHPEHWGWMFLSEKNGNPTFITPDAIFTLRGEAPDKWTLETQFNGSDGLIHEHKGILTQDVLELMNDKVKKLGPSITPTALAVYTYYAL